MWNGLSANGQPLSMTAEQMTDWARAHDQDISVNWSDKKQFAAEEVSDPLLKGARFVRPGGNEKTYEQAAYRAGWDDMAVMFRDAGI